MQIIKFKKIAILVLLWIPTLVSSQSDVKLSSFFLTPLTYNPAYAGSYEGMSFTSLYSTQWVGFEGAPKTLFVNGHGTFFGPNTGLGFEIMHDEIGVTTDTKFLGNYAYHLQLNDTWKLAMGIKAGAAWYSVDYNKLSIQNPNEFNNFDGIRTDININIGSGFFIHNEKFYLGFGVPNILKTKYIDSYNATLSNSRPNYYLSSGYKFDLQNDLYLQPSVLMRFVNGAPINAMFAGTVNWQEKFYGSLNVDLNSTIGGFAGFRIAEQFLLGYSYDASINKFSNSNGGIHSFFLNIRLEDYWQRERCGCYSF
jgi:type IX secretion system PorP/SprF family membrane protein